MKLEVRSRAVRAHFSLDYASHYSGLVLTPSHKYNLVGSKHSTYTHSEGHTRSLGDVASEIISLTLA